MDDLCKRPRGHLGDHGRPDYIDGGKPTCDAPLGTWIKPQAPTHKCRPPKVGEKDYHLKGWTWVCGECQAEFVVETWEQYNETGTHLLKRKEGRDG